jgi:hypothetical protein
MLDPPHGDVKRPSQLSNVQTQSDGGGAKCRAIRTGIAMRCLAICEAVTSPHSQSCEGNSWRVVIGFQRPSFVWSWQRTTNH